MLFFLTFSAVPNPLRSILNLLVSNGLVCNYYYRSDMNSNFTKKNLELYNLLIFNDLACKIFYAVVNLIVKRRHNNI